MDFRCERDVLGEAVAAAARAATTRGSMPVLAGVYLSVYEHGLMVRCTDLEIEVEVTVTVSGAEDGSPASGDPSAQAWKSSIRAAPFVESIA